MSLCSRAWYSRTNKPLQSVSLWNKRSLPGTKQGWVLLVSSRVLWRSVHRVPTGMCHELRLSQDQGVPKHEVPRPLRWCLWSKFRMLRYQSLSVLQLLCWIYWKSINIMSWNQTEYYAQYTFSHKTHSYFILLLYSSTCPFKSLCPFAMRSVQPVPWCQRACSLLVLSQLYWITTNLPPRVYIQLGLCTRQGMCQRKMYRSVSRNMWPQHKMSSHQSQTDLQLSYWFYWRSVRTMRPSSKYVSIG